MAYTVEIVSKFVIEVEQILEQILPFFNPFLMLNIPIPELNFDYDCKVLLNSVGLNSDYNIDIAENRLISWKLELSCDAYLFKPSKDIRLIEKIITNVKTMPGNELAGQSIVDGTKEPPIISLNKFCFEGELDNEN